MAQRYVKLPGGVILHMKDGTSGYLGYGQPVDESQVAEHQLEGLDQFTDGTPRVADFERDQELDAIRRTAEAEAGHPGSSSSPVPGNYSELDEEDAANLVRHLSVDPGQQATVIVHELLHGARLKVIDAAPDAVVAEAKLRIEGGGDEVQRLYGQPAGADADEDPKPKARRSRSKASDETPAPAA